MKENKDMVPVKVITEDFSLPEGSELTYNPFTNKYEYYTEDVEVGDKFESRQSTKISLSPEYVEDNIGTLFVTDKEEMEGEDKIAKEPTSFEEYFKHVTDEWEKEHKAMVDRFNEMEKLFTAFFNRFN